MNKKKRKNFDAATLSTYDTIGKMRGSWGDVKPVTRIQEDKRRKKPKHKGREWE